MATAILLLVGAASSAARAQNSSEATPVPPHFAVKSFVVEGAHALPQASIDQALAPYEGRSLTFADLEEAIAALRARYRDVGIDAVNIVLPGTRHLHRCDSYSSDRSAARPCNGHWQQVLL